MRSSTCRLRNEALICQCAWYANYMHIQLDAKIIQDLMSQYHYVALQASLSHPLNQA
jgi:hypothetical protein